MLKAAGADASNIYLYCERKKGLGMRVDMFSSYVLSVFLPTTVHESEQVWIAVKLDSKIYFVRCV